MKIIYLDHNATTPIHAEVKQTIVESLEVFGNASSHHTYGFAAREKIEEARVRLLGYLGASEGRIIFTSGGSESNNLVLKGLVCEGDTCARKGCVSGGRPHVITTKVEHPSVINTVSCLHRFGADVTTLPVDQYGILDPDDLIKAIRPSTVLVSVMFGNNEVGSIQPVEEIGKILRERNIAFHCDAVQAVGKIPMNVEKMKIDFLSISGHKINALKGIGALYIRKTMSLCPMIHGGAQELNLRAGTENTLGIIALDKAIEIAEKDNFRESARIQKLRDLFHEKLTSKLDGVHLNGHPEKRLPGTLNLSFDRIDSAAILEMISMLGIAASSGSACSSDEEEASHVLTAMGLPPEITRSALRFSLGYGNTEAEISKAADIIVDTVKKLRAVSPL